MKKIFFFITTIILLSGCTSSPQHTQEKISSPPQKASVILRTVSAEKFKELIENKPPESIILDVRTPQEFSAGHIKEAELLDFYSPAFQANLTSLEKNTTYYIYCRSGNRSGKTLQFMKKMGFTNVYELKGGMNVWGRKNFPVIQ